MAPLFPLLRHSIRSHFRLYGFRNGDIAEYWHSPPPSSAGTSYCDGGRIDKVEETCHVGDCTKKWQWECITGFVLATIFIRGSCEMRLLTTFTHMERITEEQLTHWVLSETFRKHFTIADEAIVFRRGLSEDAVVFGCGLSINSFKKTVDLVHFQGILDACETVRNSHGMTRTNASSGTTTKGKKQRKGKKKEQSKSNEANLRTPDTAW